MNVDHWALEDGILQARPAVIGYFAQSAFTLFIFGTFAVWLRRRHMFPISQRYSMMLYQLWAGVLSFIMWALYLRAIPCALSSIVNVATTQTIVLTYAARVLQLVFKVKIAKGIHPEETTKEVNWFLRHRKVFSRSSLIKMAICYFLLWVLLTVVSFNRDPMMLSRTWCDQLSLLQRFNAIITAVWFLILFCLGITLRGADPDAMSLLKELKYTFWVVFACLIPFIALSFSVNLSFEWSNLARLPMFATLSFNSYVYPVYLSYRHEKLMAADKERRGSMTAEMRMSLLAKMLSNDKDFMLLLEFLKSEFSAENLLFLRAIAEFKENPSIDHAKELAAKYVYPNSIYEINISHQARKTITKLLSEATSKPGSRGSRRSSDKRKLEDEIKDLEANPEALEDALLKQAVDALETAREEVFKLVARDSLPRFLAKQEQLEEAAKRAPPKKRKTSQSSRSSTTRPASSTHSRSSQSMSGPAAEAQLAAIMSAQPPLTHAPAASTDAILGHVSMSSISGNESSERTPPPDTHSPTHANRTPTNVETKASLYTPTSYVSPFRTSWVNPATNLRPERGQSVTNKETNVNRTSNANKADTKPTTSSSSTENKADTVPAATLQSGQSKTEAATATTSQVEIELQTKTPLQVHVSDLNTNNTTPDVTTAQSETSLEYQPKYLSTPRAQTQTFSLAELTARESRSSSRVEQQEEIPTEGDSSSESKVEETEATQTERGGESSSPVAAPPTFSLEELSEREMRTSSSIGQTPMKDGAGMRTEN